MAASGLPAYNVEIAKLLDWPPVINMRFPHVGMRFYPLHADLTKLQALIDAWLNFTGDTADQPPYMFRPAAPFVLLQTVNYGRLEIEGGDGASARQDLAWLKQHEVIFSVPLEWYEWKNGEWIFVDWAMTYPFIYLDHPISLWIGREMYGWPKMPVRVPRLFPLVNPPDPHGRVDFLLGGHSARNPDHPEPYSSFIEIAQAPSGFDMFASLGDWLTRGPRMAAEALSTVSALAEIARGAGIPQWLAGSERNQPYRSMARQSMKYASQWLPQLANLFGYATSGEPHEFTPSPFMKNNIVLKQFRDAHAYKSACYQALIRSELAVEHIWGGGFLFNPLLGDPSGGVTIRLHHFREQPIIDTLGLQAVTGVVSDNAGHQRTVHELKPFFPFWWDLDLSYGQAESLCWRSKTTKWSVTDDPGAARAPRDDYVLAGSGAAVELGGEARYDQFNMLVMPLPANIGRLKELCGKYLNYEQFRFEPAAPYVLAIAEQFREMRAATEPLERWADSEVTFAVAGRYFDDSRPDAGWRPVVMPMIGFVGAEWDAISDREVLGRFSLASTFVPANSPLLDDPPPYEERVRVYLMTTLCHALDENEQTRLWTLIGLGEGEPSDVPHPVLDQWLSELGLGSMVKELGFELVGLKQFRDARRANEACYQALVKTRREFIGDPAVEFVKAPIRLDIYEFDTMRLADTFGIVTGPEKIGRFGRRFRPVDAVDAFIVHGGLCQKTPENLSWRAEKMDWQRD